VAQVLINATTGHIVDGHLRVELALARHEATVPVTYVELSEQEERLVLASFDPLAAVAGAEKDALAALLAGLSVEDAGLAALLADLAADLPRAGLTDPDEAPAVPGQPYVKSGQLYRLGDHRLLCGDATEPGDVERLMDGERAECMWTDPPYGIGYVGRTGAALTIVNDDEGGPVVFERACAIAPLAPSAPFYVTVPAGPRQLEFLLAVRDVGWRLHQELVWVRTASFSATATTTTPTSRSSMAIPRVLDDPAEAPTLAAAGMATTRRAAFWSTTSRCETPSIRR
jgi:hypothetical protein